MSKASDKKIAVIFGTRPEIIKLSPLLRLFRKKNKKFFAIHTGQHYSYSMDRIFFEDLGLAKPEYRLRWPKIAPVGQGAQTAFMLNGIEEIIKKEKPSVVIVQGDTNSVLAGSLAAAKTPGVRLAHVEAGLRSYDRRMPEEINRILSDSVSDFLFAPTQTSAKILMGEGVEKKKIFMTGNTIVDALQFALKARARGFSSKQPQRATYFLLTLHRQENVDSKPRLASIFKGLERLHSKFGASIIFPAHPRTVKRVKEFHLRIPKGVSFITPVGYFDFLRLQQSAALILTDSGGVQEEACVLGVPCITLRENTERPEAMVVGANILAGYESARIERAASLMLSRKRNWPNPFGSGDASQKILNILEKNGAW